jgi:hypothetical protein
MARAATSATVRCETVDSAGTRLIEGEITYGLCGTMDMSFVPEGLSVTIDVPERSSAFDRY